ncbi:MAG: type II toxin-antitoxin system RatA family toxin [Halobacteriaceae archaeon]
MDTVEVSTLVYLPPEDVFDFLVDFPRYADYSKHLRGVRQEGDGGPGTRYALRFSWWKVSYTAHTEVTGMDPPRTLSWRVTRDLSAHGHWRVDPDPEAAPPDRETASRVSLTVNFDPESAGDGLLDLPRFVSMDWVLDRISGLIRAEGERVVERIVADLEGERRPVEVTVSVDGD